MNWRMNLSWLVLVAGGLWGTSVAKSGPASGSALETALVFSYVFWSLYWGVPAAWRWWRNGFGSRILRLLPAGLFRMAVGFSLSVTGGYMYCVFGGGVYQFVRYWRAGNGR
jgi:hypothetical protein